MNLSEDIVDVVHILVIGLNFLLTVSLWLQLRNALLFLLLPLNVLQLLALSILFLLAL
jgi:hypothetical protein